MESGIFFAPSVPRFLKPHAVISVGDCMDVETLQARFDGIPLDSYVVEGFRRKSICRMRVDNHAISVSEHGPLFQPKAYNPVHGDIVRHYPEMDRHLASLVTPLVQIFAACAQLRNEHEILVQAQRITATSGTDQATGYPVVEGWHQDNTAVLGIFLVNRVNVEGGVSLLSANRQGTMLVLEQPLAVGELLLIDDTSLWHNTTPISRARADAPAYRDVVILTYPSCRAVAASSADRQTAFARTAG